jgi:hypothetical protein
MKSSFFYAALTIFLALAWTSAKSEPSPECPATIPSDRLLGDPFPESDLWYGSEALAIQLPYYGVWSTTKAGHAISVKLFWWSAGFEPGMESNLKVSVRSLLGASVDATVSKPTNAYASDLGGWTMLTGIDFPSAGCWEFTARYLNQELRFVVETVDSARYREISEMAQTVGED